MADILSQNEIDELLRAIETGDVEEKKEEESVKVYDFKKANRFSKEQMRALNIVYRSFVHLLGNYLMGTLRTTCDVDILSLEEMSFNEFNNSVPSPVLISVLNMPPFKGSTIFEMSSEVAYSVISRVLGGTKTVTSHGRQFTEIELVIIERVIWQMLGCMDEAWKKVLPVSTCLDRLETSMQFSQIVDLNEAVVVITINVTVGAEEGLIAFCLPHSAVESVAEKLNSKLWYSSGDNTIEAQPLVISKKIKEAQVNVTAVFNDTEAAVGDILCLQVGDVIQLHHRADEPITIMLQHIPKFRAFMGRQGKQSAVKIVEVLRGDEENE